MHAGGPLIAQQQPADARVATRDLLQQLDTELVEARIHSKTTSDQIEQSILRVENYFSQSNQDLEFLFHNLVDAQTNPDESIFNAITPKKPLVRKAPAAGIPRNLPPEETPANPVAHRTTAADLVTGFQGESFETRLEFADELSIQENWSEAATLYQDLLKQPCHDADRMWIHFQLAKCYRNTGQMPLAEKHWSAASKSGSDDGLGLSPRWLFRLETRKRRMRESLNAFDEFLQTMDHSNPPG